MPTKVKKPDRKALREGPAPSLTMPANSEISMKRKAAPSTNVKAAKTRKRPGCRRSADNAPEPASVLETKRHIVSIKTLRRWNSSDPVGPPAVLPARTA